MKKVIILCLLLITFNAYGDYLGEFEANENLSIWTVFRDLNNRPATNPTVGRVSLWDKNDASAPTASASLVYWGGIENGLYGLNETELKLIDLATGPVVAKCSLVLTNGETIANGYYFMLLNSGRSPNKTANKVFDIEASLPTVRADHSTIIDEIRRNR